MKKAEAQQIAREMAQEAFRNRPHMSEDALRNYLITEDGRARTERGVDWNNHTTFEAEYLKTYKSLQATGKK